MDRITGALKGEITPTTPTGRCRLIDSRSWLERNISPYGADARAAASQHSSLATARVWNSANGRSAPDSRTIQSFSSDLARLHPVVQQRHRSLQETRIADQIGTFDPLLRSTGWPAVPPARLPAIGRCAFGLTRHG
jgi:hypothetical protein